MLLVQEEQGKAFRNFITTLKSEVTKKEYTACLQRFVEHYKITSLEDLLKQPTAEIEELFISYILMMKKRNLSRGFVGQTYSALRHFFSMNDVVLNWYKISKFKGEFKNGNKDKGYTHEQIKSLLDICDIRSRTIVLIFSSTGIRIGALPDLRLKHIKKVGDLYQFQVYENENEEYITFCTPEASKAIDSYLAFRERQGEKLTEESYLIRQQFDINDQEQIRKECKPVSKSTIRNVLWNNLIRAGIRVVNHEFDRRTRKTIPQVHGFRKFYCTQLLNSGLVTERRWLLEGHELKSNDSSYLRATEQELYDEYIKAINNLTIDPANRLKIEVKQLTEKQDEVTLMKIKHEREMTEMHEEIKVMMSMIRQNPKLASVKPESLKRKLK